MSSYLYRPEEFVMGSLGGAIGANLPVGGIDSINAILTAADPMQALIDLMQFGTKPDYMWGGNGSAATVVEIGGSGVDLTIDGATQEQTSSILGSGNFTYFDGINDRLHVTNAGLQFGSASFAILILAGVINDTLKYYFCSDFESSPADLGWRLYDVGGIYHFRVDTASGVKDATLAGHGAGVAQSVLAVRDMTGGNGYLYTGQGSSSVAQFAESCTPTSPVFEIGEGVNNTLEMDWGITAVWKGATAESLTQAHNDNLIAALGFGDGS